MAFDREKALQSAQRYVDKRKYDRAIAEYTRIVQRDPNDARTLLRIGDLQARTGDHPAAIATYDRVALYYAGRGFSLKAVAVLKQIRELIDRHAPQLADQYSHVSPKLASIYAELGLVTDALATYDAVARRLQDSGRDRDAVEIIRRMVSLDRTNPLPYLRLAEALCRVNRVEEAVEHFWSAAQVLTQQARSDDALRVIERILHFRQDMRVARVAAELYLARGTREAGLAALSRLQICFEADPRDLETLALLARAFDLIGQASKGVEVYKEMVRIAGETGQSELRQRYLEHLQRVAPNDEQVRTLLALDRVDPSQPPSEHRVTSTPPESLPAEDIEFIEDDVPDAVDAMSPDGPTQVEEVDAGAITAPPSAPPTHQEFLRKALVDAESFRGLRLYAKASQCLTQALQSAPDALELRAALQQILLESGDVEGAIEQMLALARAHYRHGSLEAAEAELKHALELDPSHSEVRHVMAELGLDLEEESAPPTTEHEAFELTADRVSRGPGPMRSRPQQDEQLREEARLPAYDLEDEEMMEAVTQIPPPPSRPSDPSLGERSRPPVLAAAPPPMPSAPPSRDERPLPSFALDADPGGVGAGQGAGSESIRAALDEAEFFSARGLYQDATLILRDRLEQYPGDPSLIEALAQLEPKLNAESGPRDVGRLQESSPASAARPEFTTEELLNASPAPAEVVPASVANAAELKVKFSAEGMLDAGPILDVDEDLDLVSALEEAPSEQVDVDEVFAKFKEGVKAQIADSDSSTHYDLGVAYKEMGLLADAAKEFEIASADPKRECTALAMMGMMYRERGELDRAAEAYVRALNASQKTVSQEVSLYYELGDIYDHKGDADEAIYYFQRITTRDPTYRDVKKRLERLAPLAKRFSAPARAINDDQDFDRTFDELYKPE